MAVNKAGLMIFTCIYVISGCAIFDSGETDSEKFPVAATGPVDENPSVVSVGAAPELEARETPTRTLRRDDIRRLQLRLKEIGLDPGPADGVAGARTKAALSRFQEGCSKVKSLIDNSQADSLTSSGSQLPNQVPSKQETLDIQSRLRYAGFDPGPIDGVFGKRTRTVLFQIKTHCPTANEFAAIFDRPAAQPGKQTSSIQTASLSSRVQTVSAPSGTEGIKRISPSAPAQSQQEIRILQLRLRDAGFDPGPFDGVMGPKTRLALQQYETSQRSKKTKISLTPTSVSGQY